MRRIRNGAREATLEPRVMQLLVALAKADGAVLTRDDLIAQCWGGRIVSDDAINRAVAKLREVATGFDGGFQVITIAKVGYRLDWERGEPPATLAVAAKQQPEAAPVARAPAAHSPSRRRLVLAALGGVGAIAVPITLVAMRRDPSAMRADDLIAQSEQLMRLGMPDEDIQGAGFLEAAVEIAPRNARAWGCLALARQRIAEYAPPERIGAAVQGVQAAARRALALDPHQIDALAALAMLPPVFGDWLNAENRLADVLRRDAEHFPTRDARDFLLMGVGRTHESARNRISYAGTEPLHAVMQYRLVYAYWVIGQIARADQTADRALHLWPRHPACWLARFYTLAFTGRGDRAAALVDDEATRPPFPGSLLEVLRQTATALHSKSARDTARASDSVWRSLSEGPSAAINAILCLAALQQLDRAFAVCDAYLLEQGPLLANVGWRPGQASINDQRRRKTHMLFIPVTAPLRADPRFEVLMQRIGLADYWRARDISPSFPV